MREHIHTAIKEARKHGGKADYQPSTPHGRLILTAPDGRREAMVVSPSPRCMDQATRILRRRVVKFMQGKPSRSRVAMQTGEKP